MQKIVSSIGLPLEWQQPNLFKMEYELKSGDFFLQLYASEVLGHF